MNAYTILNYGMPFFNGVILILLSKFLPALCKPFKFDERVLHLSQAFLLVYGLVTTIGLITYSFTRFIS